MAAAGGGGYENIAPANRELLLEVQKLAGWLSSPPPVAPAVSPKIKELMDDLHDNALQCYRAYANKKYMEEDAKEGSDRDEEAIALYHHVLGDILKEYSRLFPNTPPSQEGSGRRRTRHRRRRARKTRRRN